MALADAGICNFVSDGAGGSWIINNQNWVTFCREILDSKIFSVFGFSFFLILDL